MSNSETLKYICTKCNHSFEVSKPTRIVKTQLPVCPLCHSESIIRLGSSKEIADNAAK